MADIDHQPYNDIMKYADERLKSATDAQIENCYWLTYEDDGTIAEKIRSERYQRQHKVGRKRTDKYLKDG